MPEETFRLADKESSVKPSPYLFSVHFTAKALDKVPVSCAIIPVFVEDRPLRGASALLDWRLNGRISRFLVKNRFQAQFGETMWIPAEGRLKCRDVLLFGLGRQKDFAEHRLVDMVEILARCIAQLRAPNFLISLSDFIQDDFEWRNIVRLFVSKAHDWPHFEKMIFCESEKWVRDAKRRHMDFGAQIEVTFETKMT
jgi:hypothetical protein